MISSSYIFLDMGAHELLFVIVSFKDVPYVRQRIRFVQKVADPYQQ